MALSKDEASGAGRGRAVDTTPIGRVIYRSDFDAGPDGWTDHWDGFRPWPIFSLTEQMQLRGKRCLMLSTSEEASPVAGDPALGPAAFKRLALHDDYQYHSVSGYFALGLGGFSGAWQTWALMFDTQDYDNASRSFYKLACNPHPSGAASGFRWKIRDDKASSGDPDTFITVTEADGGTFVGNNDNKHNMCYVRLTIDRAANGGLGGYHSFQSGPFTFDLSGLGAGHSNEPPQFTGDTIADFRGGFNLGLSVSRDSAVTGGCQLFADDIVYSVSNTAPEVAA